MRLTLQNLRRDLSQAHKNGFEFYIVECIWRGHPFISEITGVKDMKSSTAGFSYMCCELEQRQLRRIKEALRQEEIPWRKET